MVTPWVIIFCLVFAKFNRQQEGMETFGYVLLAIVALAWITIVLTGLVMALPWGLVGLVGILGIGVLLIKVISDRLSNKEDDHYADNVDI